MNIKNFFKRLSKEERGEGLILITALVVAVTLTLAMFKVGNEAINRKNEILSPDAIVQGVEAVQPASEDIDLMEQEKKQGENLTITGYDMNKIGVKAVIDGIDETGLVTKTYDLLNENKKPKDGSEEIILNDSDVNKDTVKSLEDVGIPTDPVTVAVTESIYDVTKMNTGSCATDDEIKNTAINIVGKLWEESGKTLENAQNNIETATVKATEVLETVKKNLEEQKILAEKEIVEKTMEYEKDLQSKKYLEEAIAEYKEYEEEGYTIASGTSEYANLQERLDEINNKIETVAVELDRPCCE